MAAHLLMRSTSSSRHLLSHLSLRQVQKSVFRYPSSTSLNKLGSHYTIPLRFSSTRRELVLEGADVEESFIELNDPILPSPSPSSPSLWDKVKKISGLSTLLPEWKLMFSKDNLVDDLMAGITVGCVAMPLSLAIALASGVSPEVGLVSAIVGGSVACLLGGAPLGVTGPSLATTVLLSTVAATHGISALVFVTCVTGGLQVISGILRFGRLVQFVPQPVIAGFTAGVGGVMLIGQLPRVLGISGPEAPGIIQMGQHVLTELTNFHPASVALSLGTLATVLILPKFYPKVPASLVAVAAAAAINIGLGLGAPIIGAIECSFPMPSIPALPDFTTMYSLIGASLTLYGLTSLESLLSGSAADKIDKNDLRKHEPNVELVGQGLSNMAVACFGGIPVTGAIARTSLNITAGAKTRRASLFHVCVLGGVFAISPIVGMIPLSALSGILLSVAIRLLNPSELKFLSKVSYREVIPLAATFGTVLASDLVTGVQAGVATALILQVTNKRAPLLLSFTVDNSNTCTLFGDITFLSAARISELQAQLELIPIVQDCPLSIDFSHVLSLDATAGEMVVDMITNLEELGRTPNTLTISNLSEEHKRVLGLCDSRHIVTKFIA